MRFTKLSVLVFSAFVYCGSIGLATAQQGTNGDALANPRTQQPDLRTKSVLLTCNPLGNNQANTPFSGKTLRLSTGSDEGECSLLGTGAAQCTRNSKRIAHAQCPLGCDFTISSGTCTQVN